MTGDAAFRAVLVIVAAAVAGLGLIVLVSLWTAAPRKPRKTRQGRHRARYDDPQEGNHEPH